MEKEHLESYLLKTNTDPLYNKNEYAIPWQIAQICTLLEAIHPYNETDNKGGYVVQAAIVSVPKELQRIILFYIELCGIF